MLIRALPYRLHGYGEIARDHMIHLNRLYGEVRDPGMPHRHPEDRLLNESDRRDQDHMTIHNLGVVVIQHRGQWRRSIMIRM